MLQMLIRARLDLVDAMTNLELCRKLGYPQEMPIRVRHAAADRVWELQAMVNPKI